MDSPSKSAPVHQTDEVHRLARRLELVTTEYNKLLQSHSQLQRQYRLLCSSGQDGSEENGQKAAFPGKIMSFIASLLFNEKYADTEMVLSGKSSPVPCHSFVFEARGFNYQKDTPLSPMLVTDNGDCTVESAGERTVIDFKQASLEVVLSMLKWIYTDTIQLEAESEAFLLEMLDVSTNANLLELKELTEKSLVPLIDVANVIRIYQCAVTFSAELLRNHCSSVLFSHWNDFLPSDFEPLGTDTLFDILKQRSDKPLHTAIRLMREDVVFKYLLEFINQLPKAVNETDETGEIPLFIALKSHQFSIAAMLIKHGADVNQQFGDLSFEQNEVSDGMVIRKQPILHHLMDSQDAEAVSFLLDYPEMDLNKSSSYNSNTVLHSIAAVENLTEEILDVVNQILEKQTCINALNSAGDSALHISIKSRNFRFFTKLLASDSIDVNIMNVERLPPLWLALVVDDPNFGPTPPPKYCEPLLDQHATIDMNITRENVPLLNYCAQMKREEAALYLIDKKCNMNHQDSNGVSLLHIACMNNLPKLVSKLLHLGANANVRTKFVPREVPRPPPLIEITSPVDYKDVVKEKKTKIIKKKIVKQVLKQPASQEKTIKNAEKKTSEASNPFMSDDEPSGDSGTGANPFFDEEPKGENPFMDDSDLPGSQSPPQSSAVSPEFEEIEEWVEEEVTDDEDEEFQFGNALNKFTFEQSNLDGELDAISLASEASNQTPLHFAVWYKNENIVEMFLEFRKQNPDRIDLGAKNSFDQTPFALALWLRLDCAALLLKAGSDINDCNSSGECLLHQAIMHQDSESALFLLEWNANFNFQSPNGDSCLMLAIKRHLPAVVDTLCRRGADMSQTDKNNNFPLWVALETGQEDVASILIKYDCDANAWHLSPKGGYLQTLLHRAIKEKNEAVACFLARCTGSIDLEAAFREGSPGSVDRDIKQILERADMPGHMAARAGLSRVLETLIEQGFKVNGKNSEKKTSLHVAIEAEQQSCIDVLMTCPDISLSAKDARGMTPFGYTLRHKNDRAANLILQRDPSAVEHLDNRGRSLLHIAVQSIDLQSVLFLITCHANVNAAMQDKSDMTPLHVAATSDQPTNDKLQVIMRNLMLAGANVNAASKSGQTPLHLAAERGSHELCSILIESGGANPNLQDLDGNTPLHLAVRSRQVYTIRRLIELSKGTLNVGLKNSKGKTVLHTLASCSSKADSTSVMSIFPLLVNAPGNKVSLNDQDGEGNTMLLLAYINGHSQLCRALVSRGVVLGTVNKQGLSIFTYPAATTELLHGLLRLVSSEPPWSDSDNCLECGARFTVTFRRHHCRHCGRVLCSNCSSLMSPIPKFHIDKNVRVCEHCYHVIKMGGAL